jgi:dimethylhistidine N-methyltransferase
MFARALESEFAREVRAGLERDGQKTLPCQYLYDAVGSALFEAITRLAEYGLTRADERLMRAHSGEVLDRMPAPLVVAELGSGSGLKTRPLLERLRARQAVRYFPIDVSPAALEMCVREMEPVAEVVPLEGGYLDGLRRAAAQRGPGERMLALFLGSTIGNFEPDAAIDFLYSVRLCLEPGDGLLLGTDLVKPARTLLAAYDDPAGVTAAFNLNLLARINRELRADFRPRRFKHHARWDAAAQRIEMHLRSRTRQRVSVAEADLTVEFQAGETIRTECCHKFRPEQVRTMARAAGFEPAAQWTDREWPFAESLLLAA